MLQLAVFCKESVLKYVNECQIIIAKCIVYRQGASDLSRGLLMLANLAGVFAFNI